VGGSFQREAGGGRRVLTTRRSIAGPACDPAGGSPVAARRSVGPHRHLSCGRRALAWEGDNDGARYNPTTCKRVPIITVSNPNAKDRLYHGVDGQEVLVGEGKNRDRRFGAL